MINDHEVFVATTERDYAVARALVQAYAEALGVDLCFQGFDRELAAFESIYGAPGGCQLLVRHQVRGRIFGCAGVRRLDSTRAELKRLYVEPPYRAIGAGRALSVAALDHARRLGYREIVLDTLATMSHAHALYQSLGFEPIDAYYDNPQPGTRYLRLAL